MEIWKKNLTSKIDFFHQRLQHLLETESENPEQQHFEPLRDERLINGLSLELPESIEDKAIVLMSRLSSLFHAGLLFEKLQPTHKTWKPQASFFLDRVKTISPEKNEQITLPELTPLSALSTPASTILKKVGLEHLDPEKKMQAILIQPAPQYAYILISSWPDLWLKSHVEKVHAQMINGFAS
jgi:hypothetical protein